MKTVIAIFAAVVTVAAITTPADAFLFRGFGRNNIVAINNGGANVTVINQRRGLFGRRNNTQVFVNNGFRGNNVFVSNRGFRRNNAVFINNGVRGNNVFVSNRGFSRNNVVAVNVNGFRFNNFNNNGFNRVNVFGTRTFVDNGGNVFAVDAFGNTRFRGSAFRGFGTNGLIVNNGFNTGVGQFNSFDSGCSGAQCFNGGVQVAAFRGFGCL